jgi:ferredoxin
MNNEQTVQVHFLPDDIVVEAQPGEPLLQVAERAGVFIPTGCLMGHCHACEVEIDGGIEICACISGVPLGTKTLTVHLDSDPLW